MSADRVTDLILQLRAPDERLDWWPHSGSEPPQVQALFDPGCSHALVVPVRYDPGPPSLVALARLPAPAGQAIGLHALRPPTGRQRLAPPPWPTHATHLLAMGWARHRPENPTWFSAPPTGLSPALDPDTLQAALNRLCKDEPERFQASLLALASALTTAGRVLPHAHRLAAPWKAAEARSGSPAHGRTRFALASCQYPAGPLDRLLAHASLARLNQLAAAHPLDAVLMLGDQIYADASYGLLDPVDADGRFVQRYAQLRRAVDAHPALRALRKEGRWYNTPDDHEIHDNWEPGHALNGALDHFERHRLGAHPPRQPSGGFWGPLPLGGGHEVFMLDTRTERSPRPWPAAGVRPAPRIMSEAQSTALARWLGTTASPVRWVSSPVWVLPRRVGRLNDQGGPEPLEPLLCDDWSGYPASLQDLLGMIAIERLERVVVLCGDAHLAGHTVLTLQATDAPPDRPATRVDVLHCPALYAPFPFTNAQAHHFLPTDHLTGQHQGRAWRCGVRSDLWPSGNGVVSVACETAEDQVPDVTVSFHTLPPRTLRLGAGAGVPQAGVLAGVQQAQVPRT